MRPNVDAQLPNTWRACTMGEIGRYLNGFAFNSKTWGPKGRPIIRIQNLTGSGADFNYFDGPIDQRYVVQPGDLLFSWSATLGVYVWRGPEAVLNQHIFKIESFIDPGFHRYLIEYKIAEMMAQTHGTGMVHITKSKFDALPVAIPPAEEQHRIVEALDDHLSRLEAAEASMAVAQRRADELRQSLLHAAYTGSLGGGFNQSGPPPGWREVRFAEIARVDSDLTDPASVPDLPHIAPNHIESNTGRLLPYATVREDGVISAKHRFRPGHILYSKIRPYLNKVTLVDFAGVCSADMYPVSTTEDPGWLRYAMLSTDFVGQTARTQTRTVLPKINVKELSKVTVLVPPREEQARLRDLLDALLSRQGQAVQGLRNAEDLGESTRRSLHHAALTGQLTKTWRETNHG